VVGILLLLSVAMLTLYFRESKSGFVHGVQGAVLGVVAPLQDGTARATKPFRDAWNWTADLFSAKSENASLRKEVQSLRAGLANQLSVQAENKQLRGMVNLQGDHIYPKGVTLRPARVVFRPATAWYSTVTIDVGSSSGVRNYDAVVNGDGLVGRVTNVTPNASQVTLITDQESYVDAVVRGAGAGAGAQGMASGSVTGDVSLQYVDKNEKVKVGEYVVTSGRMNSIFVRGIPIGQVESVASQDVDLYQNISVSPFVNFRELDLVQVVIR
jgi:rod shape-determining protein MreC